MRKIKEILRLKFSCGLTERKIAVSVGTARSTVGDYLRRAAEAGISWPLPPDITDEQLESKLFSSPLIATSAHPRPMPDWAAVDRELRDHKNVNLTINQLWIEYRDTHPADGYQYTQFCEHFHRWKRTQGLCLRQTHRAGERVFVDYCDGPCIVDPAAGELIPTHLFVSVWGASNYTFAEASLTQTLPDWIASHNRALEYFGCSPKILVPDNLKSGVKDPCFYEPEINPTYADWAQHNAIAVIPARPRRPRDKAKAEAGVLVCQRWILAVLRHKIFHSIGELNTAVAELLERLNTRPLRKIGQSRRDLFLAWDKPAAQALPSDPYQFAEWRRATVNIDYHIEVDRHYYSVPFALVRQPVDVRLTAATVEVFKSGQRVAAHPRSFTRHTHSTVKDHMPIAHQKALDWSPSRLLNWAAQIGPATAVVVAKILDSRDFPEQGYRSALGVLRFARLFGRDRLEAACSRAQAYHIVSFKAVRAILLGGLDRRTSQTAPSHALPAHHNIRGGHYYTQPKEPSTC